MDSVLSRVATVSSVRVVMDSVLSREAMVSSVRAVMDSVLSRVATVSSVRVVTDSVLRAALTVLSRVAMVSLMVQLLTRRVRVSILPTMIPMQSTA